MADGLHVRPQLVRPARMRTQGHPGHPGAGAADRDEFRFGRLRILILGLGRHNQFPAGEQVLAGVGNTGLWHLRATHSVLGGSATPGVSVAVRLAAS